MKRYTEKFSNGIYSTSDYLLIDVLKIDTDNQDNEYIRKSQRAVIGKLADKLGKYEDGGDLVFENTILSKLATLNKKREALEKQFKELKDNWNSDTAVSLVDLINETEIKIDLLEEVLYEARESK